MKLSGVRLFRVNTPFVLEFKSTHLSRLRAESLLIELLFDNGLSGWGESAPRPYVTGETQETVIGLTRVFAEFLLGRSVEEVEDARRILDELEEFCRRRGVAAFNSALGAFDLALADGLSRARNLSFPELLRPRVREDIPYALSIPLLPLADIERLLSEKVVPLELKAFKIVLERDEDKNYERVRLVRRLTANADIRIEANGNWTVREALQNLGRLRELGISAVEQPTAARDTDGLRTVREAGIPVIVDESMCSLSDARRLVEADACDILNIKISKCGGLLRSFQIADFAETRGIPCQVGSHVGETAVLDRAGFYFASSISRLTQYEGCSPLLFGCDLATGQSARPSSPAGPGEPLGLDTAEMEPVLRFP